MGLISLASIIVGIDAALDAVQDAAVATASDDLSEECDDVPASALNGVPNRASDGWPEGALEKLEGSGKTIAFGFCGASGSVRGRAMEES